MVLFETWGVTSVIDDCQLRKNDHPVTAPKVSIYDSCYNEAVNSCHMKNKSKN